MNKGALIRFKFSGETGTVVSDVYTHRFLNNQDYEMIEHGMGEYAGSYGGAFDVVIHKTGCRRRVPTSDRNKFEIIDPAT